MNFAYFRNSTKSLEETVAAVKRIAETQGWKMLGTTPLPDNRGSMILVCRPEWVDTVLERDHQLVGFLPCAITVFKKGNDVLVGTGQPAVIKAISQDPDIQAQAATAEKMLTDLIHEAAGVGPRKVKGVTVYSTTTCPYCKMETAWLDEKKVSYETTYVDRDQAKAQEMVEKTGQMGVPVTGVVYDDNAEEFVVGFDKAKLSTLLGL